MTGRRMNRLTGEWVLYSPARAERPKPSRAPRRPATGPRHDASCILCPGNEGALPGITEEVAAADGSLWQTRAVPNKFPIVDDEAGDAGETVRGRHEIVVETPRHDLRFAGMADRERALVLEAWRRRFAVLSAMPECEFVALFRNDGPGAGASLSHAHAQIASLSAVPPAVARREALMRAHLAATGGCLVCDALRDEEADGRRIVARRGGLLAFVPYAAQTAYECWIAPIAHAPRFEAVDETARSALSALLGETLRRIADCAGDPPWNLVLHAPSRALEERAAHWWLQILPRPGPPGGFEVATGLSVAPSLPEADAARLRGD